MPCPSIGYVNTSYVYLPHGQLMSPEIYCHCVEIMKHQKYDCSQNKKPTSIGEIEIK